MRGATFAFFCRSGTSKDKRNSKTKLGLKLVKKVHELDVGDRDGGHLKVVYNILDPMIIS